MTVLCVIGGVNTELARPNDIRFFLRNDHDNNEKKNKVELKDCTRAVMLTASPPNRRCTRCK